ncbi:MAG: histone deacetylase [Armatimonadetes bacterium]|nr:histone deacetylase [Armatimonadota bacterium]
MTGLVYDDAYLTHGDPHHPENAERLRAAVAHLKATGLWDAMVHIPPRPATLDEVLWVHTDDYIEELQLICKRGGGHLDMDTCATKETYEVALLAAGGCLAATEAILADEVTNALCLVRPPGHHALPSRGMGFCFFNNVALAAELAIRRAHRDQVSIVDWDVHHGNGTQEAFFDRGDVQYISIHQGALYPGTGSVDEVGLDAGAGKNVNIMLPPGAQDRHYVEAFQQLVIPLLQAFEPEMIFVSCGFDTHAADPLARMCLTNSGYYEMTRMLADFAEAQCQGRLLNALEGGYDLGAMAHGTEAVCRALLGMEPPEPEDLPFTIHESVTHQVDDWLHQNIGLHRDRLGL